MHKNIGSVNALYPMPVTIIGSEIDGKANWVNIAHVGIVAGDMILSMGKKHYTNIGIRKNKTLSVNLVNKEMLVAADYVGIVSGNNVDKSQVFEYFHGELKGAPMIKNASITMECEVIDVYETELHENFVVRSLNTYVDEKCLDENGKIDYTKVSPILFEFPNRSYLSVGDFLEDPWSIGRQYDSKEK